MYCFGLVRMNSCCQKHSLQIQCLLLVNFNRALNGGPEACVEFMLFNSALISFVSMSIGA
jgi:hypothetical protein